MAERLRQRKERLFEPAHVQAAGRHVQWVWSNKNKDTEVSMGELIRLLTCETLTVVVLCADHEQIDNK